MKEAILPFRFSSDLWRASVDAVKQGISFLSNFMDPVDAYMLLSAVMDLKVSQVVDVPNWTVSAFLPLDVFDETKRNELLSTFERGSW